MTLRLATSHGRMVAAELTEARVGPRADRVPGTHAPTDRPLAIADFTGPTRVRPEVRNVVRAALPEGDALTPFGSRVWLDAYGVDDLVTVSGSRRDGAPIRLLFARQGRRLVHLGRLLHLEASCIAWLEEILADEAGADIVVFEDVRLAGALAPHGDRRVFRYQNNWQIVLNGPDADRHRMATKREAENRRKLRALQRDFADVRFVVHERPSPGVVDAVVGLHRQKFASQGKAHGIDAEELARLNAVAAGIGFGITLMAGGRIIAGDIVAIAGGRAFALVSGYDETLHRYSPGIIAHRQIIEACRERGLRDFNMMWGDGPYKQSLGGEARELTTVVWRRSPALLLSPSYLRTVGSYSWYELKRRLKPFLRPGQPAPRRTVPA